MQKIKIDTIKNRVSSLTLTQKSKKTEYANPFWNHLYAMSKFDLMASKPRVKGRFTLDEYVGLEQTILETSDDIEPSPVGEIDWGFIGDVREVLKKQVRFLLGKEGKSETLKPLVDFTVNSYENLFIYKMLHGESFNNPWIYTSKVMANGYLFLVSDNRDQIDEYNRKIFKNTKDEFLGNIGIVTKTKKDKSFKGFIIDNRLDLQSYVLDLLKEHAFGFSKAKSIGDLLNILKNGDVIISKGHLQHKILFPLKRTGLIGSSSTGFFYLSSKQDFQRAYDFHQSKYFGIKATMDVYDSRAKKLGYSLKNEISSKWFI